MARSWWVGIFCIVCLAAAADPSGAWGFGPVGDDPPENFPLGPMPASCDADPTGASCINAAVYYLDRARAKLGQPAYALPADFVSLAPDQQAFVLSNLDRKLYGLPVVPGLVGSLDQDAAQGVQADADPSSSDPAAQSYTSNWAGAYQNMPAAYEAWLYDDGPGSRNLDCSSSNDSGCWGHRHDVLWSFDDQRMGMGAAAGVDSSGDRGYAMLIAAGGSYAPPFTYTWDQAVADGAGTNDYSVPPPDLSPPGGGSGPPSGGSGRLRIRSVSVRGRTIRIRIAAPQGAALRCALRRRGTSSRANHFYRCFRLTVYSGIAPGRYVFTVRAGGQTATRRIRVR